MSEKKGQATFKKIEGGMLYINEKEKVVAIGFPRKIREMSGGKAGIKFSILGDSGGSVSGEKFSETEYDWVFMSNKPLENREVKSLERVITSTSSTIAVSTSTAVTPPPPPPPEQCQKCGYMNSQGSNFCNRCGNKIG